jgi:hypothetical protein
MLFHVTARALGRLTPFLAFEAATFAWARLRAAFPEALAAILLPNHLHMILEFIRACALQRRLGAVLSGLTRSGLLGAHRLVWQPVPEPKAIEDLQKLRRQVRYVALNPCRAHLCGDPLEWIWSTHRDVLGAVADPWVTTDRLARGLHFSARDFAARHHVYVSGDPDVRVEGTPAPVPALARESAQVPLETIAVAAAAALRVPVAEVATRHEARLLFVQLARNQGWRDARLLARRCGLQPWQVFNLRRRPSPGLDAARLCLGDDRLTRRFLPLARAQPAEPMQPWITLDV